MTNQAVIDNLLKSNQALTSTFCDTLISESIRAQEPSHIVAPFIYSRITSRKWESVRDDVIDSLDSIRGRDAGEKVLRTLSRFAIQKVDHLR